MIVYIIVTLYLIIQVYHVYMKFMSKSNNTISVLFCSDFTFKPYCFIEPFFHMYICVAFTSFRYTHTQCT